MYSERQMKPSTEEFWCQIEQLKKVIDQAQAILIGAGAGLSASAGYTYSGERFTRYFDDFRSKYGFKDMYSGGFHPFDTPEEYWAYWSRFIYYNRYKVEPKKVYRDLLEIVHHKEHFVLTTNVDHQFQLTGFERKRLFYTQGDYGLFQCSIPCHPGTYDNEDVIHQMVNGQKNMTVPSHLIPGCPVCGKPMTMNLRSDNRFVEDEGWREAATRYSDFLERHNNKQVLYLELGVGYNTPTIIKYPFWQMTSQNQKSAYVSINLEKPDCPMEIEKQSICMNSDIGQVLEALQSRRISK